MTTRAKAIAKYTDGVANCEGNEAERYRHVLDDLKAGKITCTDGQVILTRLYNALMSQDPENCRLE